MEKMNIFFDGQNQTLHFEDCETTKSNPIINSSFKIIKRNVSNNFVEYLLTTNDLSHYDMDFITAKYLVDYAFEDFKKLNTIKIGQNAVQTCYRNGKLYFERNIKLVQETKTHRHFKIIGGDSEFFVLAKKLGFNYSWEITPVLKMQTIIEPVNN